MPEARGDRADQEHPRNILRLDQKSFEADAREVAASFDQDLDETFEDDVTASTQPDLSVDRISYNESDSSHDDMSSDGDAYRYRKNRPLSRQSDRRSKANEPVIRNVSTGPDFRFKSQHQSSRHFHDSRTNVNNPKHHRSDQDHYQFNSYMTEPRSLSLNSDQLELNRMPNTDDLLSSDDSTNDQEAGLSKQEKSQRRKRRKSKAGLDLRIAGQQQDGSVSEGDLHQLHHEGQQSQIKGRMIRTMTINALLVLSWYMFSLSISIYNKWMFAPKYLDFHFPLFVTCLHMLVQLILAATVLYFVPALRPQKVASDSAGQFDESLAQNSDDRKSDKPLMTRMFYLTRIGPCGAATGLDIGLGNMSLKFITLTFYTMCKSSSLAFVLAFAFLFRLETPSVKLIAIIATMTVGVIMMVAGEVAFDILGFVLVILAAFFSGFRWSLTQILLLRSPATSNPFSSIFFLAPVMFLSLAIIAIPVEGIPELSHGLGKLFSDRGGLMGVGILIFPGLLAFLMTASEFALLQRTSVVTLSICGIFKEVVTISAAGIVYKDPLTPINVSGLLVTIASIAAYNYLKITKLRQQANAAMNAPDRHDEVTTYSRVPVQEDEDDQRPSVQN